MEQILCCVNMIQEVNTKGVEPLVSPLDALHETHLRLREDVVSDGSLEAELMRNAPHKEATFFVVPKVKE